MKKTKYKSKLEESVAKQLGNNASYEPHWHEYTIPESVHRYTPDFLVSRSDYVEFYIECKGGGPMYGLTPETKQKMLLMKEQYPTMDIRFVFENAKLKTGNGRGKKKVTYGEWAEINGFPWSEKVVPESWLRGNK